MSATTLPPIAELNRRAYDILCRELGVPATLRIFHQMGLGQGNYTEERKELFKKLTLEEYEQGLKELQRDHG